MVGKIMKTKALEFGHSLDIVIWALDICGFAALRSVPLLDPVRSLS